MHVRITKKMIKDYDEGRLSLKQEEKFINHIIHCNDCKEELEIYYIVSYGLDENYDENKIPDDIKNCIDSYDFKTLVELKLKKKHRTMQNDPPVESRYEIDACIYQHHNGFNVYCMYNYQILLNVYNI